jgi:predicted nucleotidyltransferase
MNVIDEAIVEEVRRRLDQVEASEGVRILLAVESGSRAWGFPSRDSDYDVRFVYIHPPEWYLSVDAEFRRDVIERPILDEIDLSGWEIRKALLLFAKSNPPLLEWLASPLVYKDS